MVGLSPGKRRETIPEGPTQGALEEGGSTARLSGELLLFFDMARRKEPTALTGSLGVPLGRCLSDITNHTAILGVQVEMPRLVLCLSSWGQNLYNVRNLDLATPCTRNVGL
jgi:hypothetical protein